MTRMILKQVCFGSYKGFLNLEINESQIYTICSKENGNKENAFTDLFKILTVQKRPYNGDIYWKKVNILKLNPTTFRSNMINAINDIDMFCNKTSVMSYWEYITDGFINLYEDGIEDYDYIQAIKNVALDFGLTKKDLKQNPKNLNEITRFKIRILEGILKGNELIVLHNLFDDNKNKLIIEEIKVLFKRIIAKFNMSIIILEESKLADISDFVITI